MFRVLCCIFAVVAVLATTPAFAGVFSESGSHSFTNVGYNANIDEHGTVLYDDVSGPITVYGTVTNWNGDVPGWKGLWPGISLAPTSFYTLSGTTVTGYTHIGDSAYGDLSHQMGYACNGLIWYQKDGIMRSQAEHYTNLRTQFPNQELTEDFAYDFEFTIDFEAETLTGTFETETGVKAYDANMIAETEFILQVFATSNDPAGGGYGYDISYTVETALPGDANLDDSVDVSDLGILATNYGTGSGFAWSDADFTGDGLVDVVDLGVLATNYGTTAAAQAVPEPSMLCLLGLASLAMLLIRRR